VQLHDLRRTAASWIAQEGYSGLAIKKLLNHTLEGPTAIYARLNLTIVREAIEWYSEAILEAVGGVSKLFGSTPIS
jgi:integrase